MKVRVLFALSILCAHAGVVAAADRAVVTVYYEERSPYQMRSGDTLAGLTGEPAARAFRAAQVTVRWEASSIARQLVMMRRNMTPSCVIGWFKTEERLQFAKYTRPLYGDGRVVALARKQFNFNPGGSLHDTLASPGVRVLLRTGYVYGSYLETAIRTAKAPEVKSPLPNSQMIELLLANRADVMFATEEEAAQLVRHLGPRAAGLQLRHFSDSAPSEPRYIACNAKVSDETIERLNTAIAAR